VGFTGIAILAVGSVFSATEGRPVFSLCFLAIVSLTLSLFAFVWRERRPRCATWLLIASLLVTVAYLHLLISFTGGPKSPFRDLYLYLPGVVFIVASKARYEMVTGFLVFVSFMCQWCWSLSWRGWGQFTERWVYAPFEVLLVGVLLLCLYRVNRKIEGVLHEEETASTEE
jgi:hypothetical protein